MHHAQPTRVHANFIIRHPLPVRNQAVISRMKIALMTEGTYPYGFGGVSVWCDQLIRGMPGYEFHLVSLVATLAEPAVWILPDNVASMVRVPLWGPQPGARAAGRPGRGG